MKSLPAMAVGLASMLASGAVSAQSGNMMNGGGWMGGYGGYWGPTLLVFVVAVVLWVVLQKRK
ncbi:MAG: hypothetical protein HIU89_08265 [Proteobacteria bacterium]|jgi:hypothetical protein|nr:hypothetical protein [Pseudomonadota bacterium]